MNITAIGELCCGLVIGAGLAFVVSSIMDNRRAEEPGSESEPLVIEDECQQFQPTLWIDYAYLRKVSDFEGIWQLCTGHQIYSAN